MRCEAVGAPFASLPLSHRYARGLSVYPVATQHTVFNLRG
jgi:hypothetical protein